jgi:Lrp/AsnC family transcriptional regulator for asnA, asnC and gidA
LLEFYTEEVSKIKDVQSVETFVVYKSYNLKVPYVLE